MTIKESNFSESGLCAVRCELQLLCQVLLFLLSTCLDNEKRKKVETRSYMWSRALGCFLAQKWSNPLSDSHYTGLLPVTTSLLLVATRGKKLLASCVRSEASLMASIQRFWGETHQTLPLILSGRHSPACLTCIFPSGSPAIPYLLLSPSVVSNTYGWASCLQMLQTERLAGPFLSGILRILVTTLFYHPWQPVSGDSNLVILQCTPCTQPRF